MSGMTTLLCHPDPFDFAQDRVHEGSRSAEASSPWAQILRLRLRMTVVVFGEFLKS